MRVLVFSLVVLSSISSFAGQLTDISQCSSLSVELSGNYPIVGERTTGSNAESVLFLVKSDRNSTAVSTVDSLGVIRSVTYSLNLKRQQIGTDVNSCEGVRTWSKLTTCTTDAKGSRAICQVSCLVEWRGEDCR